MDGTIQCPRCAADAVYAYGRLKSGKQRYLCLACNRQFVVERKYPAVDRRPRCPLCKGKMHIYRRESGGIRFRCAGYPDCHGFFKLEV